MEDHMSTFKHILVPTDFGPSAEAALDLAIDLAKTWNAQLTLFHVAEIPPFAYAGMEYSPDFVTPILDAGTAQLEDLKKKVVARCPNVTTECKLGFPREEILARAEAVGADLIVMGTHGRRGLSRVFLGSVAERVVRLSRVPVLTVRGPS
jgi:nucleotide-binding universal stress UspA family protein